MYNEASLNGAAERPDLKGIIMAKKTVFFGFEWARIDNVGGDRFLCGNHGCRRDARGRKVWFSEDIRAFACGKDCAEAASEAEEQYQGGGPTGMDDVVVGDHTLREHDHMHFDHMTRNYFGED